MKTFFLIIFSFIFASGITIFYYGGSGQKSKSETSPIIRTVPAKKVSVMDISNRADNLPPPIRRLYNEHIIISLDATQVIAEIGDGITYEYWTYNNQVPGPFIRVMEGDTVEVRLRHAHDHSALRDGNEDKAHSFSLSAFLPYALAQTDDHGHDGTDNHGQGSSDITEDEHKKAGHGEHSIDLHSVQGPGGGADLSRTPPDETRIFQFKALKPGIYVYHCGSPHVPTHIANGMYGLILVEPRGGLPAVDREFYIMQGEIYTSGRVGEKGHQNFSLEKLLSERPEYIPFNGRVGALTAAGALTAKTGEKIRLFFGVSGQLASNFHVIGEVLDRVYREGDLISPPAKNVQTTLVPGGGAMATEFEIEAPGNYILVDHALTRAVNRGALGILVVDGPARDDLIKSIK